MKPKELMINEIMIGDWVDVRNSAAPDKQHIERITPAHIFRDEIWYGIPLTFEILQKNDFEHNIVWHDLFIETDNHRILIQFGYGGKIDYILIRELGIDNIVPSKITKLYLTHIQYVHELQNAMRLCGIKKEIKL